MMSKHIFSVTYQTNPSNVPQTAESSCVQHWAHPLGPFPKLHSFSCQACLRERCHHLPRHGVQKPGSAWIPPLLPQPTWRHHILLISLSRSLSTAPAQNLSPFTLVTEVASWLLCLRFVPYPASNVSSTLSPGRSFKGPNISCHFPANILRSFPRTLERRLPLTSTPQAELGVYLSPLLSRSSDHDVVLSWSQQHDQSWQAALTAFEHPEMRTEFQRKKSLKSKWRLEERKGSLRVSAGRRGWEAFVERRSRGCQAQVRTGLSSSHAWATCKGTRQRSCMRWVLTGYPV